MSRYASPRRRRGPRLWLVAVVAAAACLGLAALLRPAPAQPQYITYGNRQVLVLPEVPVNPLSVEGFSLDERTGLISYQFQGVTGIPGIDVSSHQGAIDWPAVAGAGVEFAMIRAGFRGYGQEGKLVIDSRCAENLQGALDAGLDVGVYFFSQAVTPDEGVEEARLLLDVIADYAITYPVVFDWERMPAQREARTQNVTGEELTAIAQAFCQTVEQAGYLPAVYANQNLAYLTLNLDALKQWSFWLADYDDAPDFYYQFDLWQYSHTGSIPGVETNVDLNLAFRDFSQP